MIEDIMTLFSGAISLLCLILFIGISGNISAMKKVICKPNFTKNTLNGYEYFEMYKEELYIGNRDKAKEYLLRCRFKVENDKNMIPMVKKEFLSKCEEELKNLQNN